VQKIPWRERKQSISSVEFIFFVFGILHKNMKQWYQSRLRLFKEVEETKGRRLLLQQNFSGK